MSGLVLQDDPFQVTETLGCPVPLDEHGISVTLAKWVDVVGYEEGEERVVNAMRIGYPRFKIHAAVQALRDTLLARAKKMQSGYDCMVWPTSAVAERFCRFLRTEHESIAGIEVEAVGFYDFSVVFYPVYLAKDAKAYWQHCGEIISSRAAEAALKELGAPLDEVTPRFSFSCKRVSSSDILLSLVEDYRSVETETTISARISEILQQPLEKNSVTLTVSGMASIYTALRLVQAVFGQQESKVVVFGFPYIDTLKMMERRGLNPGGVLFFGNGNEEDLMALEEILDLQGNGTPRVRALFTEFPSNPLLHVHDLTRLSALAEKHEFLLVVDDTIANFANVNIFGHNRDGEVSTFKADIICSSLSKIFSGRGDCLAGSICINANSKFAAQLRKAVSCLDLPPLYSLDTLTLEINSRDFLERSSRINQTTEALIEWLSRQSGVFKIHYPTSSSKKTTLYDKLIRSERDGTFSPALLLCNYHAGYGGLFSIILQPGVCARTFFDSLAVLKGPSLGTSFTLVCPYTLLAHYTELEWAAQFGVEAELIRVSVGLEDVEQLQSVFEYALKQAAASSTSK